MTDRVIDSEALTPRTPLHSGNWSWTHMDCTCEQDSDLDMSVHGSGLCSPDQALQLSTAVVLRLHGQLLDVYVSGQQLVLTHLGRVDVEDLNSSLFVR